jgi:hypothetical protein
MGYHSKNPTPHVVEEALYMQTFDTIVDFKVFNPSCK